MGLIELKLFVYKGFIMRWITFLFDCLWKGHDWESDGGSPCGELWSKYHFKCKKCKKYI